MASSPPSAPTWAPRRGHPTYPSELAGLTVIGGLDRPFERMNLRPSLPSLERYPYRVGCADGLCGMLPKARVSLDIRWEAQTPDRPDAARVDAILPRPVDRQRDRGLLFGHLALVGQARRGARERQT